MSLLVLLVVVGLVVTQRVGTNKQESHLPFPVQHCTKDGGCTQQQRKLVLDANWRWLTKAGTSVNCYTGNEWDKDACPDPITCAHNCALEGVTPEDWENTYGVAVSGSSVTLQYVTQGPHSKNVGSRVYLLHDDTHYEQFHLLNQEMSFTVDASSLVCGLNGAVYLSEMPADGGMKYPTNKCGAKYGTGYCDAQCPHDMKWIHGEANVIGWNPSPENPNTGAGKYGSCCNEMDLWEANREAQAYTPHACRVDGEFRCEDPEECGDVGEHRYDGVCDKDGCDYATYRQGHHKFYGNGGDFHLDSSKPITVVTQWLTHDGTSTGDLSEIRREYIQDGKVIHNQHTRIDGHTYDSVTEQFCEAQRKWYNDRPSFEPRGGMKAIGGALSRGMTLVLSLWDDDYAHMLWLDSKYPANGTGRGVLRGPCPITSGVPENLQRDHPNSPVTFSNFKYGDIGATR